MDTTQIEFFNKFKEENHEIDVSISAFVQKKPWYVRPITVCDTSCCHYNVEFQLYYDTFLNFGKTFWKYSYAKFYVEEKAMNYFTKRNVLVVKNVMIVEIWLNFKTSIVII